MSCLEIGSTKVAPVEWRRILGLFLGGRWQSGFRTEQRQPPVLAHDIICNPAPPQLPSNKLYLESTHCNWRYIAPSSTCGQGIRKMKAHKARHSSCNPIYVSVPEFVAKGVSRTVRILNGPSLLGVLTG